MVNFFLGSFCGLLVGLVCAVLTALAQVIPYDTPLTERFQLEMSQEAQRQQWQLDLERDRLVDRRSPLTTGGLLPCR